jgi:hypothetical protein
VREGCGSEAHSGDDQSSGTWQTSTRYAQIDEGASYLSRFWIFVDLAADRPRFFVVPELWMRSDFQTVHQDYLAKHGGVRPNAPESKHHSITRARIAPWKGRWDQFAWGNMSATCEN